LRLAALLREVGDAKSGKDDPVTRQIEARNKTLEKEEGNPREV
jgi:hypothetical protein